MKKTMKGLMVMSAVVSSFFMAQVVAAETVEGIVRGLFDCEVGGCAGIVVERCTIEPQGNINNGNTFIVCTEEYENVVSLRTLDYWAKNGVDYPELEDYVTVEADLLLCGNYSALSMEVCDIDYSGNILNGDIVNCEDIDLDVDDE